MCSVVRVIVDSGWETPFGVTWVSVVNTSVYNARFARTYSKLSSSFWICSRSRLVQLAMHLFIVFWCLWNRAIQTATYISFVFDVTYEAFLQHLVGLVLSSRPNMVVERIEIWWIYSESWDEQFRRGRAVRCITTSVSCWSRAVTGRPSAWRNPCQSTRSSSGWSNVSRVCGIQTMSSSQWKTQNATSPQESSYLISSLAFGWSERWICSRQIWTSFRSRRRSCPIVKMIPSVESSSSQRRRVSVSTWCWQRQDVSHDESSCTSASCNACSVEVPIWQLTSSRDTSKTAHQTNHDFESVATGWHLLSVHHAQTTHQQEISQHHDPSSQWVWKTVAQKVRVKKTNRESSWALRVCCAWRYASSIEKKSHEHPHSVTNSATFQSSKFEVSPSDMCSIQLTEIWILLIVDIFSIGYVCFARGSRHRQHVIRISTGFAKNDKISPIRRNICSNGQ